MLCIGIDGTERLYFLLCVQNLVDVDYSANVNRLDFGSQFTNIIFTEVNYKISCLTGSSFGFLI